MHIGRNGATRFLAVVASALLSACGKPVETSTPEKLPDTPIFSRTTSSTTTADVASISIGRRDRKSTRLNSSHLVISYAVFCLKKKTELSYGFATDRQPPPLSHITKQTYITPCGPHHRPLCRYALTPPCAGRRFIHR